MTALLQAIGGLSCKSMEVFEAAMDKVHQLVREWGIPPPQEGWKAWSQIYKVVAREARLVFEADGMTN